MKKAIAKIIASGLYSGYMKPFPGTWGTIPAWLIAYFFIGEHTIALLVTAIVCTVVSIWSAGEAEGFMGHDSRSIVIDEWAGMFIALLFIPYSFTTYALAFFAFRFFDVVKIPPAAQAERLPKGFGVTFDDVVAGIQANLFVQLVIWAIEYFGRGIPLFM